MRSTLHPLKCDLRSFGSDAFEDAVLRSAVVVVELCVRCPHGPMFLPSSPREFNSRPAGKFLSLFLNWCIMSNAILSIARTIHRGQERFMTFPGEGNALLWVFQRCCVHSHVQYGTGILLQLTRFNRRHDILECPWKSKYFWYRDINYYSSANLVEAWVFDQPSNYSVPCLIDFPQE